MTGTLEQFVGSAESLVGITPYVYGGTTPAGIDCSGLPYWAAGVNGVQIARTTQGQWATLEHISTPEYGCLISFDVPSDGPPQPQHTGIWLAPNLMVSAPHTGLKVMYSTIPNIPGVLTVMGYLRINGFAEPPPPPPLPVPSLPTEEDYMGLAWSPDGTKIAAVGKDPNNADDLLVFNVAGPTVSVVDISDAIAAANPGTQKYTVQP